MMNATYRRLLLSALFPLLLALTLACTSRGDYAGEYQARAGEGTADAEVYLELRDDGQGAWRTPEDEVSFSWYVKGNEVRLNTKQGGVIVATPREDGSLEVQLPGAKRMLFKKTR